MKRGMILWASFFVPCLAFATTPTLKVVTQIQAPGGTALTVPTTGSNLISDSASQTLTNKTFNAASNTFTPNQNQDLFYCSGNTVFTLTATPTATGGVVAHRDGVLLTQGSTYDYTISSTTLTTHVACPAGARLLVIYPH